MFSNKTILVAENDETNFLFYNEVLKKSNANVLWVKNGAEAVEICKKNKIDLIIMDVQMPIMDGHEATKQIKQEFDIPIIILTAYATKSVKDKSLEVECDEFLTKPVKASVLRDTIKKLI